MSAKSNFTAVTVSRGAVDQHAGILFFDDMQKRVKLTHLAWHNVLRCDECKPMEYGFVVADTTFAEDDIIAATCNNLENTHAEGGIDYALDYSAAIFESGAVVYAHKYGGLSCSTFVLAAFASAGLILIDDRDWPRRKEDIDIQRRLVEMLKTHSYASSEHIAAQEALIGVAKRFRPVEVAAAGYAAAVSPVAFADLEALASEIQKDYDAAFEAA